MPTESWEQLDFPSGDIVVIKIKGTWGQLVMFNIYNDCLHDRTIQELTKFHRDNRVMIMGNNASMQNHHIMWLGDFNRHHPAWDNLDDNRLFTRDALAAAEVLIKVTNDIGLNLALKPGVPTHIHNVTKKYSRLDQVFLTEHTIDRVLICEAQIKERGLNTDHAPVVTKIDASLDRTEVTKTKNFRNVNWEEFHKILEGKLASLGVPRRLSSQAEVDRECNRLTEAIQATITQVVPTTVVCPHSKRWWTKELKELRTAFKKLGRGTTKYKHLPGHPIHAKFKEIRKRYDRAIKYNKRHHWCNWLEKATDPDLWTANKYITAQASDRGKTRIPPLKVQKEHMEVIASTNNSKSKLLAQVFFPAKPAACHGRSVLRLFLKSLSLDMIK